MSFREESECRSRIHHKDTETQRRKQGYAPLTQRYRMYRMMGKMADIVLYILSYPVGRRRRPYPVSPCLFSVPLCLCGYSFGTIARSVAIAWASLRRSPRKAA